MPRINAPKYYDRFAREYCTTVTVDSSITVPLMVAFANAAQAQAKNALDVGIGPGLRWLSRRHLAAKITGLDASTTMLDICRHNVTKDVHHMDLSDSKKRWPVPDNSFDLVVSEDTFSFLPNGLHVASEMVRKASKDGVIIFNYLSHPKSLTFPWVNHDLEVTSHTQSYEALLKACQDNGARLVQRFEEIGLQVGKTEDSIVYSEALLFVKT